MPFATLRQHRINGRRKNLALIDGKLIHLVKAQMIHVAPFESQTAQSGYLLAARDSAA